MVCRYGLILRHSWCVLVDVMAYRFAFSPLLLCSRSPLHTMSADSTPASSGVDSNIAASRRRLYIANSQQVFASREAIWHVLKDKVSAEEQSY
jgi:hypothetical protein